MKRKHLLICLVFIPVLSCSHVEIKKEVKAENRIMQKEDGSLSLTLDNAGRYCDVTNPSNNTADWNIVISKPGRFKVWLTSATKDTSDLRYHDSVKISLLDVRLEGNPLVDKIVRNSNEVSYPYFRADSYMGSVYVSEPGEYNLQVISDKVIGPSSVSETKLMAVTLTPEAR